MSSFFITASGTGVGKTLVTAALGWQLRQAGQPVRCLKPVISGYDANDTASDTALLLESMQVVPTQTAIDAISPWRFAPPLSPDMAAAREGRKLDLSALVEYCHEQARHGPCLVEGIGGVMVPLNDEHTVLDWMAALAWPVILVGGSYVGSLSHTLSAFAVLCARGVDVQALIISESAGSAATLADSCATLRNFVPASIPLVPLPRICATDAPWKYAPPLDWILRP